MNYRHAYHAGNFADCFKHALLLRLLDSLARKDKPYFVLDTHAGAGSYDLNADPAQKTKEFQYGIRKILTGEAPELARYRTVVSTLGLYPGSPKIIRSALRKGDRLVCCERHPSDYDALRQLFCHDEQVEVHGRSGWEALTSLLPPRERRGLVFIDPPFEEPNEFKEICRGLHNGYGRFAHGIFSVWYPIKHMALVRAFHQDIVSSGIRDVIAVELYLRNPTIPGRLNGCGMLIVNPPFQFDEDAPGITSGVLNDLGPEEDGAGVNMIRIANE